MKWARYILGQIYIRMQKLRAAVHLEYRVRKVRREYPLAVLRIRERAAKGIPLRVVFVVTESAKWKVQSLYDALKRSESFDPIVAVCRPDRHYCLSRDGIVKEYNQCCAFFETRGIQILRLYNPQDGVSAPISTANPDILFYQQSWFDVDVQLPSAVSRNAISCYVPYFVANYGDIKLDCQLPLHRLVYFHFVLNESWANLFKSATKRMLYAGNFVVTGHTMLDRIRFDSNCGDGKSCVIYAPHSTINPFHKKGGLYYSTFLWNGKEILSYAKQHLEIKWVFKPHPNLRAVLISMNVMSPDEVNLYYEEWSKIGEVYDGGGYEEVFDRSSALITDCGSFLSEYGATGKPIVHLISKDNVHQPMASSRQLFSTYYQVHDLVELTDVLDRVLVRRDDWKRADRLAALRSSLLVGNCAADAIIDCLKKQIFSY